MSDRGGQRRLYDQETQRESLDLLPLHSSQHDLILWRQGQTSSQQENFMFVSHQTRICSPAELDCVREIKVGSDECLELCQGTVLDVGRISSALNKEALAEMIAQYVSGGCWSASHGLSPPIGKHPA